MRRATLALIALASCSEGTKPIDQYVALGGDVGARVGSEDVPLSVVKKVASAQKIAPGEAFHSVVDDAISAEAARARGLDKELPTSWLLVAARARFTVEHLAEDARAKGPPSDDEVRELSTVFWREVDRPVTVRVEHAVVRPSDKVDATALKALAAAVHDAVVGAETGNSFRDAATAVPHPKEVEIRVEALPVFFTEDGSTIEGGPLDHRFAKAAHAIAKPGDTSGVVQTEFGSHVIRLIERVPEQRMPFESRRVAFQNEVIAKRSRAALDERLAGLRQANPISISPAAEQLMRGVRVGQP